MGYWKSVAAEVLPSWLKNLRARRRGHTGMIGETTDQAPSGRQNPASPHADGPRPMAPASIGEASAPGTTAPKRR
jgi:hypothetical protein